MSENADIEKKGKERLRKYLKDNERTVTDSDNNTFDLIVDGKYAEVKTKKNGWEKFDFLSLTKKQKEALGKELKTIFLVLNVGQPEFRQEDIIEISAEQLLSWECNEIAHYEWNKGKIKRSEL